VRGEFFRTFSHTYTFFFLLCLLGLLALGCARRPDAYGRQVNRALDSSVQGQELLSEGRDQRAEKAFTKSLEINRSIDNPIGTARQLNNLAVVALTRGDLGEARKLFQQALFIHQELNDAAGAAITLANLATLAQKEKNLSQAEGYLQEARDLARQSGSAKVRGQVLCQMAGLALDQQDSGTAARLLEEARPLAREPQVKGSWMYQQGRFLWAQGDTVKAMSAFQDALTADRTALNRPGMGADLQGLGQVWEDQGDLAKSFLYYARAFELYAATNNLEKARLCLDTLRRLNQTGRLGFSLKPYEKQLTDSQAGRAPVPPPTKTTGPGSAKIPTEAATAPPFSADDLACPPPAPKP
jgi:tetratricopeptide (TPR) repeat protein